MALVKVTVMETKIVMLGLFVGPTIVVLIMIHWLIVAKMMESIKKTTGDIASPRRVDASKMKVRERTI